MNSHIAQINLIFAWLWIAVGFVLGFIFGLNFHREEWLGGYTTLKRRLYRLAHISILALAIINLLFYFTAQSLPYPSWSLSIASWGFIIGAISMPICCFVMAHKPKLSTLFAVPVISLIIASVLTVWEVLRL
jgi:hypothetical protein